MNIKSKFQCIYFILYQSMPNCSQWSTYLLYEICYFSEQFVYEKQSVMVESVCANIILRQSHNTIKPAIRIRCSITEKYFLQPVALKNWTSSSFWRAYTASADEPISVIFINENLWKTQRKSSDAWKWARSSGYLVEDSKKNYFSTTSHFIIFVWFWSIKFENCHSKVF